MSFLIQKSKSKNTKKFLVDGSMYHNFNINYPNSFIPFTIFIQSTRDPYHINEEPTTFPLLMIGSTNIVTDGTTEAELTHPVIVINTEPSTPAIVYFDRNQKLGNSIFYTYKGGSATVISDFNVTAAEMWTSYDNKNLIYINADSILSTDGLGSAKIYNSSDLVYCSLPITPPSFGYLKEFAFWNRVLSEPELNTVLRRGSLAIRPGLICNIVDSEDMLNVGIRDLHSGHAFNSTSSEYITTYYPVSSSNVRNKKYLLNAITARTKSYPLLFG